MLCVLPLTRCPHPSHGSDHFNLRNGIARVVPRWTPDLVDYPHVLGMYTFGLEETNAYTEAEEFGMRTLSVDPGDTWAVHALTHVFEMQGRRNEGLRLLRELRVSTPVCRLWLCASQGPRESWGSRAVVTMVACLPPRLLGHRMTGKRATCCCATCTGTGGCSSWMKAMSMQSLYLGESETPTNL